MSEAIITKHISYCKGVSKPCLNGNSHFYVKFVLRYGTDSKRKRRKDTVKSVTLWWRNFYSLKPTPGVSLPTLTGAGLVGGAVSTPGEFLSLSCCGSGSWVRIWVWQRLDWLRCDLNSLFFAAPIHSDDWSPIPFSELQQVPCWV